MGGAVQHASTSGYGPVEGRDADDKLTMCCYVSQWLGEGVDEETGVDVGEKRGGEDGGEEKQEGEGEAEGVVFRGRRRSTMGETKKGPACLSACILLLLLLPFTFPAVYGTSRCSVGGVCGGVRAWCYDFGSAAWFACTVPPLH